MNELELIYCAVVTIWMLALTLIVANYYRMNKHLIAMAKNYATEMGQKSGESRAQTARTRIKEEHKGALLDSLAAEIPFAKNVIDRMRDGGMGDNEILVMLSDPDILNGIVRVAQGAGVVVDSLKGLIGGGDKDKPKGRARQGEIPLIETKA